MFKLKTTPLHKQTDLFQGFDDLFDRAFNAPVNDSYPVSDIYTVEDKAVIEMAVSGFEINELSVKTKDNTVTVQGIKDKSLKEDDRKYIMRKIGRRNFTKTFTVNFEIDTVDVSLKNGILIISMTEVKKAPLDSVVEHSIRAD